jgi:hypothetical protein
MTTNAILMMVSLSRTEYYRPFAPLTRDAEIAVTVKCRRNHLRALCVSSAAGGKIPVC